MGVLLLTGPSPSIFAKRVIFFVVDILDNFFLNFPEKGLNRFSLILI